MERSSDDADLSWPLYPVQDKGEVHCTSIEPDEARLQHLRISKPFVATSRDPPERVETLVPP
jgi:hypothetical protein